MEKVPPHIFASGGDVVRILTAFDRVEKKLDLVLSLQQLTLTKETSDMATTKEIKAQVDSLIAEVHKETDGKNAIVLLLQGFQKQFSDLTSQLKVAIANGGNPQDLADIAAGLTTALSSIDANIAADAAIANTELAPAEPEVPPAPAPSVSSISPVSGSAAGGESVTITGTGFNGASSVRFDVAEAAFTVVDDSTITATTPAGTGAVNVVVTGPTGNSAEAVSFTYA